MTDTEMMQQVLEAMGTVGADLICEASHHAKKDQHKWGEPCPLQQRWHIAYQALRERLAQPQPTIKQSLTVEQPERELVALETIYETIIQWDEGGGKRSRRELARRIVALYTAPQQPEQEPVAHVYLFDPNGRPRVAWDNAKDIKIGDKLYTATPQRKPLTHPQIHEFDWPDGVSFEDILLFVRAIEAAHGIKGKA